MQFILNYTPGSAAGTGFYVVKDGMNTLVPAR
jgi:hypothetical protein